MKKIILILCLAFFVFSTLSAGFEEDIKAFVKDVYDNYHFCDILLVGEDWLMVKHFKGKREGEKVRILWADILVLDEYREVGA